jgi:hypothetical protein
MKFVPVAALLLSAGVHVLPVLGVMGAPALGRLYGLEGVDVNTSILLQHRALLFGMLAVLMLMAIRLPHLRMIALWAGWFSATSFVVVALGVGGYNDAVARVITADLVVSIALSAGLFAEGWLRRNGSSGGPMVRAGRPPA